MNDKPIRFYRVGDPFGFLSNFSAHAVDIDGRIWPTSEHYFQAQKFVGTELEEAVRQLASPMDAAAAGRRRDRLLRPDWAAVRDDVMTVALRAKFSQHTDLKKALLATGDADLVEHTANDRYWADGGDGSGRNRLGELLMQIRSELRSNVSADQSRADVAAGLAFVRALTNLTQPDVGTRGRIARDEAKAALTEWDAAAGHTTTPREVLDVARGLSPDQRAELVTALRSFTEWAERPDDISGRRIDSVIASLEQELGPFLTPGRLAEERKADSRIRESVQTSIAQRLREAGAAAAESEDQTTD
jgi:ribA/ribD-fused uncharacterized protein